MADNLWDSKELPFLPVSGHLSLEPKLPQTKQPLLMKGGVAVLRDSSLLSPEASLRLLSPLTDCAAQRPQPPFSGSLPSQKYL